MVWGRGKGYILKMWGMRGRKFESSSLNKDKGRYYKEPSEKQENSSFFI